jgi:hypothetical protein
MDMNTLAALFGILFYGTIAPMLIGLALIAVVRLIRRQIARLHYSPNANLAQAHAPVQPSAGLSK